jgi:hypothetical protein
MGIITYRRISPHDADTNGTDFALGFVGSYFADGSWGAVGDIGVVFFTGRVKISPSFVPPLTANLRFASHCVRRKRGSGDDILNLCRI